MRKIIPILLTAFLISCGKSVVSSRDAIVTKVEINNFSNNHEKYRICAKYIGSSLFVPDLIDGRLTTNGFVVFTDVKYNVGDTIRLLK